MIDSHFHLWTQDNSSPEKRAERANQVRKVTRSANVDKVCLIHTPGSNVEECRENNEIVAKYVEEHPNLFYGWARANPLWGEESVDEFRRAVEEDGLIGLKLYAEAFLDDPEVEPLAEAAVDMDVPIISHVAHRTERYEKKPKESTDEHVRALAERFPKLKLISGHIGGGGFWERRIKNIAPLDNVYLDTSGSVTQDGVLEMAVDYLGADRLVYGTDTWFYPGNAKFRGSDLTSEEKATIAYNMETLIHDGVPNKLDEDEVTRRRESAVEQFDVADQPHEETIIEANAFVGHHPFRRMDASPQGVIERMDRKGVNRAIVSSMNSLLYNNPHSGNLELSESIEGHEDRLIPFATIDPTYPAWRTDLQECLSELGMRGVKLVPSYHDYDLDGPAVVTLLAVCAEADVPVIFAGPLEDQRGRHSRVKLRGFETANSGKNWSNEQVSGLIGVLEEVPEVDVIVANISKPHAAHIKHETTESFASGAHLKNATREGKTMFVIDDMSVNWPNDAAKIVENIGIEHLVCGPRLPVRNFDAHYCNTENLPVTEAEKDLVRSENLLSVLEF